MTRCLTVLVLLLVSTVPVAAQVNGGTVPYVFVPNTTILSEEVNANFESLFSGAVDRTEGSLLGPLTTKAFLPDADATYDLGTVSKRYRNLYLSGSLNGTGATSFLDTACPQTTFGYSNTQKWTTCTSATGTVTFDAVGTSPNFVFADPVSFAGGVSGIGATPAGMVAFFDLAACPTGWSEFTAGQGRYVVGLLTGGTLRGTAGTAFTVDQENRAVGQHTHSVTDPGHTHTTTAAGNDAELHGESWGYDVAIGTTDSGSSTTGISLQNAGTVSGTNAPYIQLLICRKD